jgi:antitoxin (DNA-binding transcriptional repressor) of toxin-antitoxin stability system
MKGKIMQTTMAVEDIKVTLPELLDSMTPGDEVILTRNQQPVAKLVSEPAKKRQPRKAGNCIGMMRIVADDDEHLEDFEEYM